MNSERFIYIRSMLQDQPGLHRVGMIMLTKVDNTVYITASLKHPKDRFIKKAAIGMCRKRRSQVLDAFHISNLTGGIFANLEVATVDSGLFLRSVQPSTSISTLFKWLGIKNPIDKNYIVDETSLETAIHHEISRIQAENV